MKFRKWIPLGSLILLLCAGHGDATLILGSMLMTAAAAMTGGLIMGPLTVGGLIMMMMMAANQQAQQRTQSSTSTPTISTTLENSQNLLNLLSTLTGAASNIATSGSNTVQSVTLPSTVKASKRHLYAPQNLEELLAQSSRSTSNRRQWKSIPQQTSSTTTTSTTTTPPSPFHSNHPKAKHNDFWNAKPSTYFSPDTGFAVEPIPDDLLDIAMRIPQAKSDNMANQFETGGSGRSNDGGSGFTAFSNLMDMSPPAPISDEQLRWIPSEPGDLFSSFPQVTEEDLLNFVRKRSTREAIESTFRLEDIANVTYASEDETVNRTLTEREREDEVNTRIFRQLSALDPFRCLPQLACTLQANPPSTQSGVLNDYAYLLKTVFARDEDEEDDEKELDTKKEADSTSSNKKKNVAGSSGGASGIVQQLDSLISGGGRKKKKVLAYKSPSATSSSDKKKKKGDKPQDDKDEEEDDDDDRFSSEEDDVPMNDEELERLMLKEQYEMEQMANEELLNDDPDMLPFVLKSASKAPPHLGPDQRPQEPGRKPGRLPQAPPLPSFDAIQYRMEDLEKMSSAELSAVMTQLSYPGEDMRLDMDENRSGTEGILTKLMPQMPQLSFGFSRRRTTGNQAFDDDPFFEGFKKRSLDTYMPAGTGVADPAKGKLRKVRRRVVRKEGVPELRRIKRQLAKEEDPAEIFRMAAEAGQKVKSARQCRFLFNTCPMNSSQLLNMIGNIRNAVLGLSTAQQVLGGSAQRTTAAPAVSADLVGTLATIGPNIVKLPTDTAAPPPTTTPVPPMPAIHQMQPVQGMPSQTMVVPQIIQIPMPIQSPQGPTIVNIPPQQQQQQQFNQQMYQQSQQMHHYGQMQQQQNNNNNYQQSQQNNNNNYQQPQQNNNNNNQRPQLSINPIFNVPSDSSGDSGGSTSISHELPSGEKLEINLKVLGQNGNMKQQSGPFHMPMKTSSSSSSSRPSQHQLSSSMMASQMTSSKINTKPSSDKPVVDLLDLFDSDKTDNVLLPSKSIIDTVIREPTSTSSLDSLTAAILAIEKINQVAGDKTKIRPLSEDDEKDDFQVNKKLVSSLSQAIIASTRKPGMRLPNKHKKKNPNKKNNNRRKPDDQNDDEGDDDESSEEDEEDDEDGAEQFHYGAIRDPMDPQRRQFIPVPTKNTQFPEGSDLTVPATQTFVKKTLQLGGNMRRAGEGMASSEEAHRRQGDNSQQSSEEEEEVVRRHQQRSSQMNRYNKLYRRPKILYPQEEVEKPVFIPL